MIKSYSISRAWRYNIVKNVHALQIHLYIQMNANQNHTMFFEEIDKLILKCIWKCTGSRIAKTILTENKFEGFLLSDFKTYYNSTEVKTVWFWQESRHIDQWSSTENSEIDPHINSWIDCLKKALSQFHGRKEGVFWFSFYKWFWNK